MNEPLLSLTPTELRSLAGALASGRLGPPYSAASLERFVSHHIAESIAATLAEQSVRSNTDAIARTMGLLATALDGRPRIEDLVQVVTTGSGSAGGPNRDTSVIVAELFRNANQSVIVAGYTVHQGQKVFRDLAARMAQHPELQVRMYLNIQRKMGNTSTCEELVREFAQRFRSEQWPSQSPVPEIYYDERSLALDQSKCTSLHAKCVVVDDHDVLVSSANFTEAAQIRNIEIGLLLHSDVIAARIVDFLDQLRRAGVLRRAV